MFQRGKPEYITPGSPTTSQVFPPTPLPEFLRLHPNSKPDKQCRQPQRLVMGHRNHRPSRTCGRRHQLPRCSNVGLARRRIAESTISPDMSGPVSPSCSSAGASYLAAKLGCSRHPRPILAFNIQNFMNMISQDGDYDMPHD